MIEVGVLLDRDGQVLHWHQPGNASSGALPDSRTLWDIIWENRERVGGFAHTHPWNGEAWPSGTDLSTFHAIEVALGRELIWWIVTFTEVRLVTRDYKQPARGPERFQPWGETRFTGSTPWLEELRERSHAKVQPVG